MSFTTLFLLLCPCSFTTAESEGFSQLTSSPEYTVELSDNYLHCCGTHWNGSVGLMSYEAVNHSAPRCVKRAMGCELK